MERRRKNRLQNSWLRGEFPHPRGRTKTNVSRGFTFEETAIQEKKSNQVKMIITGGVHVISDGSSGKSSIELDPAFIPSEETSWMLEQLKTQIPWEERDIKVQGEYHRQPRLTAWFGDFPYSYSGLTLQPHHWTPLLNILRERISMKTGLTFNSMLANLYRNEKDSVDWHSDDEESLGKNPTICSLSFGETRNFEMRKILKESTDNNDEPGFANVKIPLPSGCLLIMSGACQTDWQHRIAKEYHSRGPRINLTFRNIHPTSNV